MFSLLSYLSVFSLFLFLASSLYLPIYEKNIRDRNYGHLFGILVIIKSHRLPSSLMSLPQQDGEEAAEEDEVSKYKSLLSRMTQELLRLSAFKIYFQTACNRALEELVAQVPYIYVYIYIYECLLVDWLVYS